MDNAFSNDVYTVNQSRSLQRNFFEGSTKADTEKMGGTIGGATGPGMSGAITAEGARTVVADPEHKLISTATAMAYTPLEPGMVGEIAMPGLRNMSFGTRRHSGADELVQYTDQLLTSTVNTNESFHKQLVRLPHPIMKEQQVNQ